MQEPHTICFARGQIPVLSLLDSRGKMLLAVALFWAAPPLALPFSGSGQFFDCGARGSVSGKRQHIIGENKVSSSYAPLAQSGFSP
jgi:hypothetical protein